MDDRKHLAINAASIAVKTCGFTEIYCIVYDVYLRIERYAYAYWKCEMQMREEKMTKVIGRHDRKQVACIHAVLYFWVCSVNET